MISNQKIKQRQFFTLKVGRHPNIAWKIIHLVLLIVSVSCIKDAEEKLDLSLVHKNTANNVSDLSNWIRFEKHVTPLVIAVTKSLNESGTAISGRKKWTGQRLMKAFESSLKSGIGNWMGNLFNPDSANEHLQVLKHKLLGLYAQKSEEMATGRGDGIGFPSLEGALLSLAFLTFAVFLIDLVQTLLSRLRLRTPAGVVQATSIYGGKKKRSLELDAMSTLTSLAVSAIERPFFYLQN